MCWTQRPVLSLVPKSTTMDCHNCCMTSCTGSTFQTEYSTRSQSRCSNVCWTEHRNTWSTAAFRSLTSPLVNIYNIIWLCRATDEEHSVARPSLLGPNNLECTNWLSPRPITQCQWLLTNVKEGTVHKILVYSAKLRCCTTSRYINLLLTLTLGQLLT